MIAVSKDEFYRRIYEGGLDVHPSIVTRFPFTSDWKFHRRLGQPLFGRSVQRVEGGRIETDYFVAQ
jgi:hypothetical protein